MSDAPYARAGRVMFLIVWIILFAGMFLFFYYYENSANKVYASNPGEFSIGADSTGHYRIKGRINEHPVEFLVDTGATLVAIPKNIADTLRIEGRYPITVSTANGQVTGSLARVEQLSFGEFNLQNVKVVIMPNSDDDEVLLGMNVLSQFNLVQEDKRLVLKKQ